MHRSVHSRRAEVTGPVAGVLWATCLGLTISFHGVFVAGCKKESGAGDEGDEFRRPGMRGKRRGRRRRSRRKKRRRRFLDIRNADLGTVVHVVDGDTVHLKLLHSSQRGYGRVRLAGINAPECQKDRTRTLHGGRSYSCIADQEFFGLASFRILRNMVRGRRVRVRCKRGLDGLCRTDTYGRYLLDLELEGRDVAEDLVLQGAALAFTR